jgi:CRISPR/Cas system CSM-associated protein Csm4 (group 5 of RAMP superfamily)
VRENAAAPPLASPPGPKSLIPAPQSPGPQWLLSLFSPSATDAVEWSRGNYSLVERGGRIESSAGSGALKKQVQMVAEGSVLYAEGALRGAAPDVAPDGFAHPVFRAGFAVAIPLPEAS